MAVVINIKTCGGYDIPSTYVIMVAPERMSTNAVKTSAKLVERTYSKVTDADEAVDDLKTLGFEICIAYDCTVGGDT